MIARKVCIGSISPENCLYVREVGKGEGKVLAMYYDTCIEAAVMRMRKELKEYSRARVAFLSLVDIATYRREVVRVLKISEPRKNGSFLERLLNEVASMADEYEMIVEIKCMRDSLPVTLAIDGELRITNYVVLAHEETLPKYLRSLSKGKNVASVWVNCGEDFSLDELENVCTTIKRILEFASGRVKEATIVRALSIVKSNAKGIFIPLKRLGEEVVEGEAIGFIKDERVVADSDGLLAYISRGKLIDVGDELALIVERARL